MPASNLSGNTGEVGGGIGAGLSSFVQAYQTALNYQLAKSQAAAQANYQQQMADVAMKNADIDSSYKTGMLGIENQKIPIEKAKAASEMGDYFANKYGLNPPDAPSPTDSPSGPPTPPTPPPAPMPARGLVNPLPLGQVGPQPSPQLIAQSQQNQAQLQKAPVNALPQGQTGPQPSPGMLANSVAANGPMPPQGPGQAPMIANGPVGPPAPQAQNLNAMPLWQRKMVMEKNLASQAELAAATNKSKEAGTNWGYQIDPATNQVVATTQGPLTGTALLEQQTKQAQLKDITSGSRSAQETISKDFAQEPNVAGAKTAQDFGSQALYNAQHRTPAGDAANYILAIKNRFPNEAAHADTIEAIQNSQSIPDQAKNILNQRVNGLFTDAAMNNIMGDIASTNESKYASFKGKQADYLNRAQDYSVTPDVMNRAVQDSAIEKTHQGLVNYMAQRPAYQPPGQRPDAGFLSRMGSNISGFLTGQQSQAAPNPSTAKGTISPDVLNQYAKKYGMDIEAAKQHLGGQGYGF